MPRFLLFLWIFSGWNISACLLRQYHFVNNPLNWNKAWNYCRKTYTDLATVESAEEMQKLIHTVSAAGYGAEVWTGLYSRLDWKWSDGFTGNGAEYRNWEKSSNEPDFNNGNQFCVTTGQSDGWFDDNCSVKCPVICYTGTGPGRRFVLVSDGMNWTEAQSHCREKFTDLATVSPADLPVIQNLMQPGMWAWIGLFRDPQIYWSDSTPFSFNHWDNGRHKLPSSVYLCGYSSLQRSGRWELTDCERRLPFVCYGRPQVQRQVVRVRVRVKTEGVDPNDPAVKATLLHQLQDRLEESGLSEFTLKWGEQPDGKVFSEEERKEEGCHV